MSDHFLNKLKSIRQRYGIQKSQNNFIKIEERLSQITVNKRNFSVKKQQAASQKQRQPTLLYISKNLQKSKEMNKRSQSFNKRQIDPQLQHRLEQRQILHVFNKRNSDRIFRQKDYNRAAKAYVCNEPQCQPQLLSRTYSQQKTQAMNKYDLIYNYDENINTLPTKSQFINQSSQQRQRQPLRLNNRNLNIDSLNFNYDSLQKPAYQTIQYNRPPSMSFFTREQSTKPDWTIDKLCKVQQKIQAYLRR